MQFFTLFFSDFRIYNVRLKQLGQLAIRQSGTSAGRKMLVSVRNTSNWPRDIACLLDYRLHDRLPSTPLVQQFVITQTICLTPPSQAITLHD
jgi:hypothetical protein